MLVIPLSSLHRTHAELRPPSAASWVRRSLATSLRSKNPYSVNLLLGGFDVPLESPHLYWIDYLGTLATVPYAAHGYGAYFALSTLDAHWEEEMEREKGIEVLKMCLAEVKKSEYSSILSSAGKVHRLGSGRGCVRADITCVSGRTGRAKGKGGHLSLS